METFDNFKQSLDVIEYQIADTLIEKNRRYGNSALCPINAFSKIDASNSIAIRLDDKVQRVINSETLRKNDIYDLIGYMLLLHISYIESTDDEKRNKYSDGMLCFPERSFVEQVHTAISDMHEYTSDYNAYAACYMLNSDVEDELPEHGFRYLFSRIVDKLRASEVVEFDTVASMMQLCVWYFIKNDILNFADQND